MVLGIFLHVYYDDWYVPLPHSFNFGLAIELQVIVKTFVLIRYLKLTRLNERELKKKYFKIKEIDTKIKERDKFTNKGT